MKICSCGFPNEDEATVCKMCGSPLEASEAIEEAADKTPCEQADSTSTAGAPNLLLENIRTKEVITVTAPGGILGRAGDFSPDCFSAQVSGVHLAAEYNDNNACWTLRFLGRNSTSLSSSKSWIELNHYATYPVYGGELLKMADMLFQLSVEDVEPCESAEECTATDDNTQTCESPADESKFGVSEESKEPSWVVICPVCATHYTVDGPDSSIKTCTVCADVMDKRKIARVRPIQM